MSDLQAQYAQRRQERAMGMALYMSLVHIQNLQLSVSKYSWPEDASHVTMQVQIGLTAVYEEMKRIEQALLDINSAFYAPIIPTEEAHKFRDENGNVVTEDTNGTSST